MPDWIVILGIVLGIVFVSAFLHGMFVGYKENTEVRDHLIEKYGLNDYESSGVMDRNSKEGDIQILDEKFVGKCSVTIDGIVFLQYGFKRDSALLFSWEIVESFSVSSDRTFATFTLPREVGLPHTVRVPWSSDMSLAKEQAMPGDGGSSETG